MQTFLFYPSLGYAQTAVEGAVVPVQQAQVTDRSALRAQDKKPADPAILAIIGGYSLEDMGNLISPHIEGRPSKPFKDNQNPDKDLTSLLIRNPKAEVFTGTQFVTIVPEAWKKMSVAQFIQAQFRRLIDIATTMNFRAEFINFQFDTKEGYVICRAFKYNPQGMIVGEHREYLNTRISKVSVRPARVAQDPNAQPDLGAYNGEQITVTKPVVQEQIQPTVAAPETAGKIKAG